MNLALLLLLLYLLIPLLIPSFLFDPSTSAHFLNHYPTLAQAKIRGIPTTKPSPETQRRWRNYLRRLRSAGAGPSNSSDLSHQMKTDLRLQSVRRKAGIIDASDPSASSAAAKSTYSLLPAYHPSSIKWTVYTPRTLAVHDGTGLSLSESDVRATYDERRDGPGSAGSAAEQRKKAVAQAHARLGNDSASLKGKQRQELDEEEAETEIGGYADPDAEGLGSGGADPSKRILLAIEGEVYDVTRGKNFYGPGGPYAIFAGRDASIGMAKQSFDLGGCGRNVRLSGHRTDSCSLTLQIC